MDLDEAKRFLRDAKKCGGFYGEKAITWLISEVERLTAGIQKAIDTPEARCYILEHTLKNGVDNCCEGRCQGHTKGGNVGLPHKDAYTQMS